MFLLIYIDIGSMYLEVTCKTRSVVKYYRSIITTYMLITCKKSEMDWVMTVWKIIFALPNAILCIAIDIKVITKVWLKSFTPNYMPWCFLFWDAHIRYENIHVVHDFLPHIGLGGSPSIAHLRDNIIIWMRIHSPAKNLYPRYEDNTRAA